MELNLTHNRFIFFSTNNHFYNIHNRSVQQFLQIFFCNSKMNIFLASVKNTKELYLLLLTNSLPFLPKSFLTSPFNSKTCITNYFLCYSKTDINSGGLSQSVFPSHESFYIPRFFRYICTAFTFTNTDIHENRNDTFCSRNGRTNQTGILSTLWRRWHSLRICRAHQSYWRAYRLQRRFCISRSH